MVSNPGNPFGIPDTNPLKQSLEMMSQVWGNLGNLSAAAPISPAMTTEELDKRITDLRAIENWLNLNLTMLRGSIQGLEVQRATISTLRSFAQSMQGAAMPGSAGKQGEPADVPSPLDIVLGLRPAPAQAAPRQASSPQAAASPASAQAAPKPEAPVPPPQPAASAPTPTDALPAATAWWTMLQDQFSRIAAAAAPSAMTPPPADPGKSAPAPTAPKKAAARKAAPRKRAPAKTTPRGGA